ncbi:MAG: hypothetical protein LBM77_05385 [Spirochaetaceae bacterium]|jgi:diacylglycerol kinase family enzyme|nr:hypothetical protein [Spirochaetaceae bacterium]
MSRRHLYILNPRSFPLPGALERMKADIADYFKMRDADGLPKEEYEIQISTYPREAIVLIRDYVAKIDSADTLRVYACGGDGIAFDCVNGMVGLPNVELALVPYGSSNDFVRNFTINGEIGASVTTVFRNLKLQAEADLIATDVVKCSNQQSTIYSLCDCLFGVEAAAAYNIASLQKKSAALPSFLRKFGKNLMYTYGGLQAVFDHSVIHEKYKIIADGEDISGAYATINISNIPCYGGDKNPVITACPTDGCLDMLTTKGMSPWQLLPVFTGYLSGKFCKNTKIFTLRRVKKIEIKPESPQLMVNLDGEAFFDLQSTVEVLPGAINITCPGGAVYRRWEPVK